MDDRIKKAVYFGCDVTHPTFNSKEYASRLATLTMVFKLAQSAEKRWRRLNGHALIQDVIRGVVFTDGFKKQAA